MWPRAFPSPKGTRGLATRNVIVKAGLRLLTEACRQVLGAAGPGSPPPEGAFWPGSRSPHSAEPGARGEAQRANPESPLAPKIKAPVLTQGEAMLPGRGPQPRMRSNSPAGGMPGGCPEAGAPHTEAPRLLQRGWPGNYLSTCEEERKGWLPGFTTGVSGTGGGKGSGGSGTGTRWSTAQGQINPSGQVSSGLFPLRSCW